MENRQALVPVSCHRKRRVIPCLQHQWVPDPDSRWSEDWLHDLMIQSDKQDPEFEPRVNLCIRTDLVELGSALCMSVADLAHACLSNYFAPYRDAASVTWISRDQLRQNMLTSIIQNDPDDVQHFVASLSKVEKELDKIDAILYVSRDARDFMNIHRDSFLNTLATCLRTQRDRMLVLDMSWKPDDIL